MMISSNENAKIQQVFFVPKKIERTAKEKVSINRLASEALSKIAKLSDPKPLLPAGRISAQKSAGLSAGESLPQNRIINSSTPITPEAKQKNREEFEELINHPLMHKDLDQQQSEDLLQAAQS